jgi:hypothetical protein
MIRAIAKSELKSNFGLILKNLSIAAVLILGLSQAAKAEKPNDRADLNVSCNPFLNYDLNSGCSFDREVAEISQGEDTQIAQTRRGRRRKSKVQGYYGGFSAGIGFPSGTAGEDEEFVDEETGISVVAPDYTTSFDGSIFGGIKFTKNIGADLEFLLALGGISDDLENSINDGIANNPDLAASGVTTQVDGDFSAFAFYINPRFELPLGEDGKFSVYASPGIGLAQTNVNVTADVVAEGQDTIPVVNQDASNTGISFQVKGGANYLISDTTGIFGQVRYANLPTEEGYDSISIFGVETGLTFNF